MTSKRISVGAVAWAAVLVLAVVASSCGSDSEASVETAGAAAAPANPVDETIASETEAGFTEVHRLEGSVEFRGGLIVGTTPNEDDVQMAVPAEVAFEAAVQPASGFGLATLTESKPVMELVRITNEYRGEVDPDTLEFTPEFVDKLVWLVVYEDILWDGVGGGPAPLPGQTEAEDEDEEVGLSDAVIVVDALTGEAVHAFTDHASYVAP